MLLRHFVRLGLLRHGCCFDSIALHSGAPFADAQGFSVLPLSPPSSPPFPLQEIPTPPSISPASNAGTSMHLLKLLMLIPHCCYLPAYVLQHPVSSSRTAAQFICEGLHENKRKRRCHSWLADWRAHGATRSSLAEERSESRLTS